MAADQVEIQIPKTIWPEETVFVATAYFRTRSTKAATAPTTIHYRIDDLGNYRQILDWTSGSAAASLAITITASHNQILDDANRLERKQLTVQADRGLSTQINGYVVWQVRNLEGIT